jgi:hypothetical protein
MREDQWSGAGSQVLAACGDAVSATRGWISARPAVRASAFQVKMTGVDVGSIVAMVPADSGVEQPSAAVPRLDPDSAGWLQVLAGTGPAREVGLARLHEMLVRIARGEVGRRAPRLQLSGPELDDLAYQAAADALIAITGKLGQFRGESRFTTWAYKFVIFEVSDQELTARQRKVFEDFEGLLAALQDEGRWPLRVRRLAGMCRPGCASRRCSLMRYPRTEAG